MARLHYAREARGYLHHWAIQRQSTGVGRVRFGTLGMQPLSRKTPWTQANLFERVRYIRRSCAASFNLLRRRVFAAQSRQLMHLTRVF